MVEPEKLDTGIWKCPICGFTAMSKKVVEQHIQREHPSEIHTNLLQDKLKVDETAKVNEQKLHKNNKPKKEKEKRDKGKKKERRPWFSKEYEPLIGKEVTVVLRNGVLVFGVLKEETQYNLVLTDVTARGRRYEIKVDYFLANKGNISHVHPTPQEIYEVSKGTSE